MSILKIAFGNVPMEDYNNAVTTEYASLNEEILSYYNLDNPDLVSITTCIHHYVYNQIPYDGTNTSSSKLRSFQETFYNGGNCEEQCILLTSLLESFSGLTTEFIAVQGKDCHLVTRVKFPGQQPPSQTANRIREVYRNNPEMTTTPSDIHWETYNNTHWFIADPVQSRWLGDIGRLEANGYIQKTGDNDWQWTNILENDMDGV